MIVRPRNRQKQMRTAPARKPKPPRLTPWLSSKLRNRRRSRPNWQPSRQIRPEPRQNKHGFRRSRKKSRLGLASCSS